MEHGPELLDAGGLEWTEEQAPAVVRFPRNLQGRDFVLGDVHGMFPHLQRLMERVDFDPTVDRIFCVGDLVDRGPRSAAVIDWLAQEWFFSCRGNHEHFAIYSVDPEELDFWVRYNGGAWWLDLSIEQQALYRSAFLRLPLAMEVETDDGVVGVVHADVPPALQWNQFSDFLRVRNEDVLHYALFSRNRIYGINTSRPVSGAGVVRVYCGHTPVREIVQVDNVHFIDTAAVYAAEGYASARLTMVEIQPPTYEQVSESTGDWRGNRMS